MRKILLTILCIALLSSCVSYSVTDGLKKIELPESSNIETRFSVLDKQEKERIEQERIEQELKQQKQLEAERKAEEIAKQKKLEQERLEKERIAKEKAAIEAANALIPIPYPSADELVLPHVYNNSRDYLTLDNDFSLLSVLFLPLGNGIYTEEEMVKLSNAIKDLDYSLTVLTGSKENNLKLAALLDYNSCYVNGGLVISDLEIDTIDETIIYKLNENKTIELGLLALDKSFDTNLDINELIKLIDSQKETSANLLIEKLTNFENNSRILALSSIEPSHLDWDVFSPIEYRDDYEWTLSNMLIDWDDAYRATHYTNEIDLGLTLNIGNIKERLDFLYSQNIMIVDSNTITLPSLYEKGISALAVNYIIP